MCLSRSHGVVLRAAKATSENIIYSGEMQLSLKLVERAVNQNAFDDILQDFKSQPRLKNNRYEGLFCTYAYPAPYPEGTWSTRIS